MTLTELRYVVAVARHLHFARAAEACFVSQPTLTVGVRKLEEDLGVRLFERNRSGVIITPVGEAIVAQAEEVLRAVEAIRETAAAAADPLGGELSLGVIYTIGPYLVPRLISSLKASAPALSLLIKEDFTDTLAELLKRGEIDAAIMSLPFDDPQLVHRPLYQEPFKVALPAGHRLSRRKRIRASDFENETLLLLGARNCFREQVVDICPDCATLDRRGGSSLQKTLEGSSLETICQMVAMGAGLTILPQTMPISEHLAEHIVVRPFAAPQPTRTVAVFYRRGFARPALVNSIVEAVRAAALEDVRYLD